MPIFFKNTKTEMNAFRGILRFVGRLNTLSSSYNLQSLQKKLDSIACIILYYYILILLYTYENQQHQNNRSITSPTN